MMLQFSANPPIDRTNRTGSNCTGCHSGTLNSGSGSISMSGFTSYYPGGSYTLTLDVSGTTKHGFQVTSARASSNTTAAGSFTSGTGYGVATQGSFSYARHSSTSSLGSWSISWTAPSTALGSVTFYGAGVAANNNFGTTGDQVYAGTYTVTQLPLISYTVNKTDPSCIGVSDAEAYITSTAGGAGGPYTITWPTGTTTSGDTAISLGSGNYNVTVTDGSGNEEVKSFTINQGSGPSIAATAASSLCGLSTGSVTANVTGGASPYTYQWQNFLGVTGALLDSVPQGSYKLVVIDSNGCQDSTTSVVGVSGTALQAFVSQGEDFCNASNGYLSLDSVAGANGSYSFIWSTGDTTTAISGISSSQTIQLSILDSTQCNESFQFQVNAISYQLSALVTTNPDFCGSGVGGASAGNVGGGSGSYTYQWSNGDLGATADSLIAGLVSVTITDSVQCSSVFTENVASSGTPILSPNGTDSLTCYADMDGFATVSASNGIAPYSFSWSNGVNDTNAIKGLMAGTYKVTVTDSAGCFDTTSITILQPDSIQLDSSTIIDTRPDLCVGKIFSHVSGGTPGLSYLWNDTTASTNDSLVQVCPGIYELTVTDLNGCQNSFNFELASLPIPSSARELNSSNWNIVKIGGEVLVTPELSVEYNMSVYSINGQLLKRLSGVEGEQKIDIDTKAPVIIHIQTESKDLIEKLF